MSIEDHIRKTRKDYSGGHLDESMMEPDPFKQFEKWFGEAVDAEVADPHAMVIATVSETGKPSARVVLLRGFKEDGFVFFTNYQSRKAKDLLHVPKVAAVFYWNELERQVRIEGAVKKVSDQNSDDYFQSRPRDSQIAAWASSQSKVIPGRGELERLFAECESRFADKPVPRPENWGGFRIIPVSCEFWQGRPKRLHDRILYTRAEDGKWKIERLAP